MSSQESQPFQWHYTELTDHDFQIRGRTLFYLIVLFSIVLVVTLFFLYAKWVCRFNRPTTSHAPHAPPTRHRGLDNSTINALPITLSKNNSSESESSSSSSSECCICLGVFEDGDKVKVLPRCHHCFHCECVDKWLMTHSSCPLCRASLRVDSAIPSIV